MFRFFFRARNAQGEMVLDSIEASSELEAKKLVSSLGLIPIEVKKEKELKAGMKLNLNFLQDLAANSKKKVSIDDFLSFSRQFHIIYKVGLPIVKGLALIEKQTINPYFKKVIRQIGEDISQGQALHEAFGKHPDVFDEAYISLLRVGVSSGKLDFILERVAQFTSEKMDNRDKVSAATLYPKIVGVVFAIVVLIVVYWVIPKIKVFFDQFNAELPLPTRMLVGISDFCIDYWYLFIGLIYGTYYAYGKIYETQWGRDLVDGLTLKIPVIGSLVSAMETRVFCSTLELLMAGGVPILEALRLVKSSLNNVKFRSDVDRCISSVDNGGSISAELEKETVFPPLVPSLLSVGEDTGEMEKVLSQVGGYYHAQVRFRLENIAKVVEPVLIFFIFAGVLILALAVYLPIWRMNAAVRGKS